MYDYFWTLEQNLVKWGGLILVSLEVLDIK